MKHLLDTRLNKVTNDLVEVNAVWPFSNLHLDKLNWCCAFLFLVKTLRTLTPHPYYCYDWQQRQEEGRGDDLLRGETQEEHEELGADDPPQHRLCRRCPLHAPHLSRRLAAGGDQRTRR